MFDIFSKMFGIWPLLAILGVIAMLGLSFLVPGLWRKLAGPMAGLGLILAAYFAGKRKQRSDYQKKVKDIKENREKAYEEITDRNTDHDDVLERLRDGSY